MERRRAVAVSNVRRSKSLLFDYMHIGALIEEPKTQISRRRSISSLVRENKDYINDFDELSVSAFENLDKWKSARRQRVPERLLSRAEEAKKLLEEEEQRQIRKVKTFSEMMQQRQHRQQGRYSLNFFQDIDDNFDEENKENDMQRTARLTTADSVDSQSEGKSSDGASSEERLTESESHGSEERLASPVEVWTADSGVDSFSGSNHTELAITTSTDLLKEFSSPSDCQPIPRDESSNPNEVIIRLSINPSSDIFGFTLTQDGQKVVVESVDEDGVADLAGLKKNDEIISLNGVLADSPGSVPSSMDLALMTGQLEMVIYRMDASGSNMDVDDAERMSDFQRKIAKFSGDVDAGTVGDKTTANEVIIEPKLVERRKSQLFIQALQLEQQENEEKEKLQDLVPVEDQLVLKRKNSLSKSMNENRYETTDKKASLDEIEPQIIERKKAEFIRQASSDNIARCEVKTDIAVEPHIVLQRKASIENCAQRQEDIRVLDLQPSVPVAQLKASIENCNSSEPNKPKTPSVDIELTIEERKASFFEHSGKDIERTTVDVPIEPKLIEQRKASFIENRNDGSQRHTKGHLDLDIQPKLLEQRKANFLENASKTVVKTPQDEAICFEKKRLPLQHSSEAPLAHSDSGRKVELTVNNMQSKPKCEVPIEPDLIRKRKEALFCSSSMTNEIERRRVKLANIEAEVYGEIRIGDSSPPPPPSTLVDEEIIVDRKQAKSSQIDIGQSAMSPAGCSETSEDSRSMSSSTTTVTEIRREVGNIMLSSVGSGSLYSPVSDRNESPAHLSDVSPEEICSPRSKSSLFESARDEQYDYGIPKQFTPAGAVPERRELSDIVLDSPPSEGEQNVRATLVAERNTRTCVKDAGHTPWVKETSRRDELPARQPVTHSVTVTSKSLEQRPTQLSFLKQGDDFQKCEVVNLNSTPPMHHHVPASTKISIDVDNHAYENHELGAGERMNPIPPMYEIYDQLPAGQPPRGHKKGVPPPPPNGVVPYGEELYENAPQFKTQPYYPGGFQPAWKEPMNPRSAGTTHVQVATNVQTSHHTQPPSHTREDNLYGELRKPALDSVNHVEVKKRENQIRRQERKSYHEGIVNYPAYDYLGQQYSNCPEDIYENTRRYASRSCEDISDATAQYAGRTPSQFTPGKDLSLGKTGYGHDIYENVEAYAKNTDYRNNLHKPSVSEDFYEVPRRPEQSKVKIPASQSSTHDQMQRSRSQPYMGAGQVGVSDPKLRPQRSSAENLEEPRPLTAEIGAKRKPAQTNKPFNANHWLIQEAEMRRQLEANIYASAIPQTQSGGSGSHCGPLSSIPTTQANITNVALNVSEASPQVPPMRKTAPPNSTAFTSNQSGQPLAISGKKRCSLCTSELGRGAAMVIESLQLHFHLDCFRCCVCKQRLGNGTCGTDVRVRNSKLHCQNCYSNDEAGVKLSRV